ncbi:MAG: hypothetical protein AAF658_01705, partial [Myxococcota bacterium]
RGIRENLVANSQPAPPLYIVLATDGEPDFVGCLNPNPTTIAEYKVLEAVDQARLPQMIGGTEYAGVETFSLSVGSDISVNHFQDVANAGAGVPTMVANLLNGEPIGTFPTGDFNSNDGSVGTSSNAYFNAYSGPSTLHESQIGACAGNGDCPSGFECERGMCEINNTCIEGFDNNDDLLIDGNNSQCSTDRMTRCTARNWPLRNTYGGAPGEFFESLSSRAFCNGSTPCAAANEACVDNACVLQACTPDGAENVDGDVVMAPCFIGNDGAALGDALEGVFTEVLSCIVDLSVFGPITADGTVFLDDDPLLPEQWRIRGINRIEVLGAACDTIREGNSFLSVEINTCVDGG